MFYDSQGQYDKALEFYGKALTIKLATLGDNHPDTAACLANIGDTLITMGNRKEGRANVEKAVAVYKSTLGDNHPKTKKWVKYLNSL